MEIQKYAVGGNITTQSQDRKLVEGVTNVVYFMSESSSNDTRNRALYVKAGYSALYCSKVDLYDINA